MQPEWRYMGNGSAWSCLSYTQHHGVGAGDGGRRTSWVFKRLSKTFKWPELLSSRKEKLMQDYTHQPK